ncbi:DUF5713 family protein [Roseivirga sp. BDSF3-8]|uniref:DUF5713 family protein n=1 Tax=Roseivirga sp. BDSF3-8 TaxID=3241598 RepID=UPI0035327928
MKNVLVTLCFQIESEKPKDLEALYALTHEATERINDLEDDFFAQGSEIETAAREIIAIEFEYIAQSYGFAEADIEELIAPRNW